MASKSRRQRRKQSLKDTRKNRIETVPAAEEQPAAAQIQQTAAPLPAPPVSTTKATKPTQPPATAIIQYPHVAGEIKLIGILALIMLVVLGILSRVIS